MSQSPHQSGKGMKPRAGYNPKAYRDNWDSVFGAPKCEWPIKGQSERCGKPAIYLCRTTHDDEPVPTCSHHGHVAQHSAFYLTPIRRA